MEDVAKIRSILDSLDNDYVNNKKTSLRHYDIMKRCVDSEKIKVGKNTLQSVEQCFNAVVYDYDKEFKNKKIHRVIRCKDRFCPICQKIDGRKRAYELLICSRWIIQIKKKALIFLTLTVPNCEGNELRNTIDVLIKSWAHMTRLKRVKNCVKGSYRKIEVTYNVTQDDYHPHLHLMIAVNRSYFKSKNYITQNDWSLFWKQSVENVSKKELDQIPIVDVKAIGDEGATFEIAKYCAKPTAEFYYDEDVYSIMRNAVKRKQLVAAKGLFAEAIEKFNDGELDFLANKKDIEWVYRIRYEWDEKAKRYRHMLLDIDDDVSREELMFIVGNKVYGKNVETIDIDIQEQMQIKKRD